MKHNFPQLHEIAAAAAIGDSSRRSMSREQNDEQDELRDSFRDCGSVGGSAILRFAESRDMTASGTTSITHDQGGMTIGTDAADAGPSLLPQSIFAGLGAQIFTGLRANLNLPRNKTVVAPVWLAENAATTQATDLFALDSLTPKRVTAWLDVSVQLLKQGPRVEQFLRNEMTRALAAEIQRVAIAGTGASNQPTGILNAPGIGSVVGGVDGAAPTLANVAALEYAVTGTAKADRGNCAFVCSPYVRQKLRQTFVNGTGSAAIWGKDEAYSLLGHPAGVTPSSPDTLTKGASAGICSAIIFGEMSELIIGLWGSGMIVDAVYDKAGHLAGTIRLIATAYVDVGVRSPEAFASMQDALCA